MPLLKALVACVRKTILDTQVNASTALAPMMGARYAQEQPTKHMRMSILVPCAKIITSSYTLMMRASVSVVTAKMTISTDTQPADLVTLTDYDYASTTSILCQVVNACLMRS